MSIQGDNQGNTAAAALWYLSHTAFLLICSPSRESVMICGLDSNQSVIEQSRALSWLGWLTSKSILYSYGMNTLMKYGQADCTLHMLFES